jgi:hypothetical protein
MPNADQMDIDNDLIGDACDDCVGDCNTASIGNYVWHDLNGDGIQDVGEPGLEGIEVQLFTEFGVLVGIQTTNGGGFYLFQNLEEGKYYLRFEDPTGEFEFTKFKQGNFEGANSDVDNSNGPGTTMITHLGEGELDLDHDAGLFRCVPLGEKVWFDTNLNHTLDNIENGLNNIPIRLWQEQANGNFNLYDATTSAHKPGTNSDDGYYNFCAPPGTYFMELSLPNGLISARENALGNQMLTDPQEFANDNDFGVDLRTDVFTVMSGMSVLNISAGIAPHAQVGDRVWLDTNQNGLQDAGEDGMGDVLVEAFDLNNNIQSSAITNGDGIYNMEDLGNTEYFLKFTPPSNYSFAQPLVGSDKTIDSDVVNLNGYGTTQIFGLNSGDVIQNRDAGIIFSTVPVDLLSFEVERVDNGHKILWETANEINLSHFEVEFSFDNLIDFETIESIPSSNTVASDYFIVNEDIKESGTYYYRLRSIDLNGDFSLSDIRSLQERVELERSIYLYPNPTNGDVTLEVNVPESSTVDINILDISGRKIGFRGQHYNLDKGQHLLSLESARLFPGVYVVDIRINNVSYKKKLVRI